METALSLKKINNRINLSEVEFIGFCSDPIGRVFSWEGGIFRAIYPDQVKAVNEMFTCGLIGELVKKNLFPETFITDYELQDFGLVLEHRRIPTVTYVYGWSFSMVKDAALTVLEVNRIASKYGYQTRDAHPYNVLFEYHQPKFIDFGSFVKIDSKKIQWPAFEEFVKSFYYPLKLWESGNHYFAQRLLSDRITKIPHSSYYLYKFPFLRLLPTHIIDKFLNRYYKFRHVSLYSNEEIKSKLGKTRKAKWITALRARNLLPFQKINYEHWEKKIKAIKNKSYTSQWGDYHSQYQNTNGGGSLRITSRFNRILEIVNSCEVKSAVELGGNQGIFSQLLLQKTKIKNVICTDYDANAIEALYNRNKELKLNITPVLLDFIFPVHTSFTRHPSNRFQSDIVVALALTHHLILTQNISIEEVFKVMSLYTKKYIAVEFMPIGLYHPKTNPEPVIPEWYTQDWFRENFENFFTLIHEEKLEKNRVLFFGKVKGVETKLSRV